MNPTHSGTRAFRAMLTAALLVVVPPRPVPAQDVTPPPVRPLQRRADGELATIKASARLVVLDIVVTDGKGKPVTGLKQTDFALTENGAAQKLTSFTEHAPLDPTVAANAAPPVKLPPNVFTNNLPPANETATTVILLDALDTPVTGQMVLRDQMIAFMKTVQPGTQMAIFQLDTSLHMVQGVTADPETLRAAASGKRDEPKISPLLGGPYAPGEVRERLRRQVLTESMQTLARYLAAFPGRKNLIWFTGAIPINLTRGYPGDPFPDLTDITESLGAITDVLTLSRIAVYPIDSRGLRTDPRFSAENGGRGGGFGNGGGFGGGGFGLRQAEEHGYLDDVADKTGGKAFYNTNGLKQAIAEVVDTGSHYYTVTYAPTNKATDGTYRALKVQMALDGLHLEYRRGYYARPDGFVGRQRMAMRTATSSGVVDNLPASSVVTDAQSQATMNAAMKMGAVAPRDIVFYATIKPGIDVLKDQGDASVPKGNFLDEKLRKKGYRQFEVHYATDARSLHFTPSVDGSYHDHLEYVALVYDDQGQRVNGIIARIPVDMDRTAYEKALRGGIGVTQTIAVPAKGNYFLRLGVHDVNGDLVGVVEIPVDAVKLP